MTELQPKKKKSKKFLRWFLLIVFLILTGMVYWKYFFVLGEGVKAGELNYLVYKGVIFKTYEGKLIQTGFRADKPGGLQSNQFDFSVADKEIANRLMTESGKQVQLHYKEYNGALPWRGYSKYVVDRIISIEEKNQGTIEQELTPYIIENL